MSAPHRASAAFEVIDLGIVAFILGCLAVVALSAREALRRRRVRRWPKSWTRDFRAEAQRRNGEQP